MVFHVGVAPHLGEIVIYDSEKLTKDAICIPKVDENKFEAIFNEIDKTTLGKLGCCCVYLTNGNNSFRKLVIETAKKFGFLKIQIIDKFTALYLNAISQSSNELKNNEVIWIYTGSSLFIWQKTFRKAKLIKHLQNFKFSSEDNLKSINEIYGIKKGPSLILTLKQCIVDKASSLPCKMVEFNLSLVEGALIKARILAQERKLLQFDANTVCWLKTSVVLERHTLFYFPEGVILPITRSLVVRKNKFTKKLKICEDTGDSEVLNLPECEEISITFSIDSNNIYSLHFESLDKLKSTVYSYNAKRKHVIQCIGVDPSRGEVMIYDSTSDEPQRILLKKGYSSKENPEELYKDIREKLKQEHQYQTVIHADDDCFNNALVKYITIGRRFGFSNIHFISSQTAELLNILQKHPLDKNICKVAFICDRIEKRKLYCQIWKKEGNTFIPEKSFFREGGAGDDNRNLQKLKKESNALDEIDMVFVDDIINTQTLKKMFPRKAFEVIPYYSVYSNAALIKARIIAKDPKIIFCDVQNNLNRRISISINDILLLNFQMGEKLPLMEKISERILLDSQSPHLSFKFCERNACGTKWEQEFHMENNINFDLYLRCNKSAVFNLSFQKNSETPQSLMKPLSLDQKASENSITLKSYVIPKGRFFENSNIMAVGIDFGTTRCCIAVNRRSGIETVALENASERLMPSYVAFDEKVPKCGKVVVSRLRNRAASTVFDVKQIMGKEYKSITHDPLWPFSVVNGKDNSVYIKVQDWKNEEIQILPEKVSAILLNHMRKKAEEFQGTLLTKAVITVPAIFTEMQKEAYRKAADEAGWDVLCFLPEPIAAAFAHFHNQSLSPKMLDNFFTIVVDLGGGTLDVCIFTIKNDVIEITNASGDTCLGGRDFDNILFNYFGDILEQQYAIRITEKLKYLLMLECQDLKHTLSVETSAEIDIENFILRNGSIKISREEFEVLCQSLLQKIKIVVVKALSDSGLTSKDINKLIYVGGGCRMPMIRNLFASLFENSEHYGELHPDEAVAVGAAYYAYHLLSSTSKESFKLTKKKLWSKLEHSST